MDAMEAVLLLQAGLMDEEAWEAGLDALSGAFGAEHMMVVATPHGEARSEAAPAVWKARIPDEFLPVIRCSAQGALDSAVGMALGKAMPHQAVVPDEIFRQTPQYTDVVRPLGGRYAIVARPFDGALIAACRSERAGYFSPGETGDIQRLLPLVASALRIKRHIQALDGRRASLEAALDEADLGVILLDLRGRALHLNRAAEEIVLARDGLDLTGVGPAGAREGDTKRLRAAIAAADGEPCLLPRPSGKRPLVARAVAAHGGKAGGGYRNAVAGCIALFVRDPDRVLDRQTALAAKALGLTPRESTLVNLLVRGLSVAEAAADLGISVGNARMHLKHVFQKTDTHSQAELLRLVIGARL